MRKMAVCQEITGRRCPTLINECRDKPGATRNERGIGGLSDTLALRCMAECYALTLAMRSCTEACHVSPSSLSCHNSNSSDGSARTRLSTW